MNDFSEEEKIAAWKLADEIADPSHDPNNCRSIPVTGVTILWDKFNIKGRFGWTIKDGRPVEFNNMTTGQAAAKLAKQRRGL